MMFHALFVSYIVLNWVLGSSGQSYDNTTSLLSTLLSSYNIDVRPLEDQSGTVKVNLSLNLYNILNVDTVQGILTLAIGLPCSWYDERIRWNASDYGGISSVKIQQQYVWKPGLVSSRPVEFTTMGAKWMYVTYQSDGLASWHPAGVYQFACPMNIKHWPFDEQECDIVYFIYGFYGSEVLLQQGSFYKEHLQENGEWSLESHSVSTNNRLGTNEIVFKLKLRRLVIFYTDTLIVPLFFLSFLSCFVFLLPSESGERVSFCITILLSMTVFLDVISDEIPKLSNPVPMLCQFLLIGVVMNAVVTILVVLNLWLYYRSNDEPIGKCYRFVVQLARCRKKSTVGVEDTQQSQNGHIKNSQVDKMMQFPRDTALQDLDTGDNGNTDDRPAENKQERDCDITWQDVSTAFDRLLFILMFGFSIVCIPVMILLLCLNIEQ